MRSPFSAALAALCVVASGANAATYRAQGSFTGGQLGDVTYDIVLTGDFTGGDLLRVPVDSAVLTSSVLSPFNPADVGGVGYTYYADNRLAFGGFAGPGPGGIVSTTTDFIVATKDWTTAPSIVYEADSLATISSLKNVTSTSFRVTNLSAVPLPAPAPLLLSALGLLILRPVQRLRARAAHSVPAGARFAAA